jgi:hypothetical protein
MSLLITILIFVLIAAVVLWLANVILANLPIGTVPRQLILAVIALLLLLIFLQRVGVL